MNPTFRACQTTSGHRVRSAGPGYKQIVIRPQPVGDLRWVDASYDSIHGPIAVRWDRDGASFNLSAKIPANTTATVHLPARENAAITEGANPSGKAPV